MIAAFCSSSIGSIIPITFFTFPYNLVKKLTIVLRTNAGHSGEFLLLDITSLSQHIY
jgi:hypothetical protein